MEQTLSTQSRIEQLIDYRLQLVHLLGYCDSAEGAKIRLEIALIDSFISDIRGSKPMILVADDEQRIAETLVEVLRYSGYEAFSAVHVEDAVVLSADLHPDLALIDVMLGNANGVDLALQMHKSVPKMKLLLVSGHPEASDYVAAAQAEAGRLDFLERPVPTEELLTTIAALLGRPDTQQTGRTNIAQAAKKAC